MSLNKRDKKNTDVHSTLNELKETLTNAVGDKASDVQDKATAMVNNLLENFQNSSHEYQENLVEAIVNKPLKSVLIAAGLGALLAKILL